MGLANYYILVYSTVYFHVDGLVRKLHGSAVNDYGYTPCLHIVVDIAETTMTMWTLAVGLGLEGELPKSNIRNRIAKTKKTNGLFKQFRIWLRFRQGICKESLKFRHFDDNA